jgi:hypothetical protein
VIAHIATGGMGSVYKAVDTSLGRPVALKVLADRLVDNPAALERFRREARHAACLNHPNIVTLYEWGQIDDSHYLAMEYVDGPDLDEYILTRGRLDVEEAHAILVQATQALDHAYRQGVVHRDIKPSNFLMARQEGELLVKLTDLGLARNLSDDDFRLTRDGSTVGTVDYLSPEQARDSSLADTRSDIYSLGCTAYHMLAGHPPFPDGGLGERVYKHMHTEPPDLRRLNPSVPPSLWAVLKRMLAKAPGARYQKPAALLHDLQHLPGVAAAARPAPPASPGPRRAERPDSTAGARSSGGDSDVTEDGTDSGVTTPDQRHAAAGQYERAREVLAVGDGDYARHLLLSCCKLDPANLRYRKTLRKAQRKPGPLLGRLLAILGRLAGKARLKVAQRKGDHRKVLELGEAVLAFAPKDIETQLEMARAADALRLPQLSLWLAEQAQSQAPHNPTALRALARLHERQRRFGHALKVWDQLRQEIPNDPEALRKLNDLAAQDTIQRGNYRSRSRRSGGKPPSDF